MSSLAPYSQTPSTHRDHVSHPYKTTGNEVQCVLIFKVLDSKREEKRYRTEWYQAFPIFKLLLISSCMQSLVCDTLAYMTLMMALVSAQKLL
jgi:hypothetical protein